MSNLNKEILCQVEQIQKVYKQSFFETIRSSIVIHSNIDDWDGEDVTDEELLAYLKAEIHVMLNG